MDNRAVIEWAKGNLPLAKSDYSQALDEIRWNASDRIYGDRIKLVAQYRCGGDGRSVMVSKAMMEPGPHG